MEQLGRMIIERLIILGIRAFNIIHHFLPLKLGLFWFCFFGALKGNEKVLYKHVNSGALGM